MTNTASARPSRRLSSAMLPSLILLSLVLGATLVGGGAAEARASDRPDIVVLMLDDMPPVPQLIEGMPTVSLTFGAGISFSNYFGNDPLCCPGRAAFLTGQYSHHHGVTENDGRLLDPSMTIATQLHAAGYQTAIAGKYLNNLAHIDDKTPLGWDRSTIFSGGYYDYQMWREGVQEAHGFAAEDYSTDVISDAATKYVRVAPASKPLFLMLAPFAAHAARAVERSPGAGRWMPTPAPRHLDDPRCASAGVRKGPAYNEADMSDKPTFFQDLPPVSYADGWPLQLACSTLLSVDEMFASVKIELARRGRKNVLFVLLADNGMGWGDHRWPVKQVSFSTAMPLSIRWEGHDGGPRTVSDYVQNVDLAPTLAEIGGAAMGPYPNGQTAPDGKSQAALLAGGPAASRPSLLEERAAITNESGTLDEPGWYAIRTTPRHGLGLWHYIEWNDGQRELYDLATDPSELDNVADTPEHSDVQAALALQLARLKAHF